MAGITLGLVFAAVFLFFALTSRLVDLDVYRMGGTAILHGADPYAQVNDESGLPFTYTPFAAAVFAPVSLPPVHLAQFLWSAALLVALYFFCALPTAAVLSLPDRRARALATCAVTGFALTLEPVRSTFSFGQINIFLALLVALDLFGRRRLLPRGVLIGVAAGVKLTPLVFLLYLVWVGRWREAATAAISFGATVAVGFAVSYGPSATYWTHTFFDAEHIGGIPYVANQSVLGVLSRLMSGPDEARPLYLPIAGLVLIAGLIAAVRLHRRGETLLAGSACALTGLIVSPISWSHHWVWLVPLLLCLGLDGARPRWGRPVALAGAALAVLAPIWWAPHGDNAEFGHDAWQIACANSYAAAATALLAALLWYSRPRGGVRTP